jgi:sporulation-control protein spo0M
MTTLHATVAEAPVDLTLELPPGPLTTGSTVEGSLTVRGERCTVDPVSLGLFADVDGDRRLVASYRLTDSLAVEAADASVPVTVAVPHSAPVTREGTTVRVAAGTDPDALADEARPVEVGPGPVQSAVLDAVRSLGFDVGGARCVADDTATYGPAPGPVQLFECVPTSGPFERRLDRLELAVRPDGREMAAYLDLHREGGLFTDAGGEGGRTLRVALRDPDAESVAAALRKTLERHA